MLIKIRETFKLWYFLLLVCTTSATPPTELQRASSSSIQLSHNTLVHFCDFKQKIYNKIKIEKIVKILD